MAEKTFIVGGMSCIHCVNRIKNALLEMNGVKEVNIDLEAKSVFVVFDNGIVTDVLLREIIEDEGYSVMK